MDRRAIIEDFVHQRGIFRDAEDYVDRKDLDTMKFHMQASEECHRRAKTAEMQSERERLKKLASWHLFQVDQLLGKYGQSKGLEDPNQKTDEELADMLFKFSQ